MVIVGGIGDVVDTYGLQPVPGSSITDPAWLRAQLDAAARRYRFDRRPALGVLWWYSASVVLLGPPVEAGADPALDSLTLYLHPDGRILDARSDSVLGNDGNDIVELGHRLEETLSRCIEAIVRQSGASPRALWAIATDSLANRVLWAGGSAAVASRWARAIGSALPAPRYVEVAGRPVVRRASCCLIYQAPGVDKCTSCPRQSPERRRRRLEAALGGS
jgi:hypothetical protein